ncbi:hypothetical protein GGI07_002246 [Coemansia sp. Benny D115]|nr:hypothetical protein GGI07_002246 [Coemansia sp. Benny D115]
MASDSAFIAPIYSENDPEKAAQLASQFLAELEMATSNAPQQVSRTIRDFMSALQVPTISTNYASIIERFSSFMSGVANVDAAQDEEDEAQLGTPTEGQVDEPSSFNTGATAAPQDFEAAMNQFNSLLNDPSFREQIDAVNNPEDAAKMASNIAAQLENIQGIAPENLSGPLSSFISALKEPSVSTDMNSIVNEVGSFMSDMDSAYDEEVAKSTANITTLPSSSAKNDDKKDDDKKDDDKKDSEKDDEKKDEKDSSETNSAGSIAMSIAPLFIAIAVTAGFF